jgi:hypothetical protein
MSALIADLLPYLIAIAGGIAALLGYGARQKAKGRSEARMKSKEADHEKAAEIRNRIESDLSDRLREFDDAGYRD